MASRGVHFDLRAGCGDVALRGNRKALAGAFVNLLENALQACSPGGEVRLEAHTEGGLAWVCVADSGQGMPAEVQERLFEPFFTTRTEGTGLGLAIVRSVVAAHGGEVRVESAPGRGAAFRVEPAAGRHAGEVGMKPLPVLIVEDDASLREALTDTLELSGLRGPRSRRWCGRAEAAGRPARGAGGQRRADEAHGRRAAAARDQAPLAGAAGAADDRLRDDRACGGGDARGRLQLSAQAVRTGGAGGGGRALDAACRRAGAGRTHRARRGFASNCSSWRDASPARRPPC